MWQDVRNGSTNCTECIETLPCQNHYLTFGGHDASAPSSPDPVHSKIALTGAFSVRNLLVRGNLIDSGQPLPSGQPLSSTNSFPAASIATTLVADSASDLAPLPTSTQQQSPFSTADPLSIPTSRPLPTPSHTTMPHSTLTPQVTPTPTLQDAVSSTVSFNDQLINFPTSTSLYSIQGVMLFIIYQENIQQSLCHRYLINRKLVLPNLLNVITHHFIVHKAHKGSIFV